MATASTAYRNSDGAKSGKPSDFLSRADIAELLDAADFSHEAEAYIIRRAGREKGVRNYRRRHLVAALKGIWRAASSPYGTGEIQFYASVEGYAIEAGVSERALRYNLRELERIGVIEMIYAANTIRRPATYRLNVSALRRRRTYQDLKSSRPAPTPFRPHNAQSRAAHHVSSPPAQEAAAAPSPASVAAPVAVAPRDHRDTRRFRQLRASDGKDLVAKILELQKGTDSYKSAEGFWVKYPPGHPSIRPPLSAESALTSACLTLRLPEDASREYAERCGIKFKGPQSDEGP